MFFLERSSQIQLFQNEKVIISHHKSTEVVKIVWLSHTSLLLLKKIPVKQTFSPSWGNWPIWIPVEAPETRGREGESKSLITTTVGTTSNTQLPMGQYHYIQMSIFFYIPTIIAGGRESQKASQPQPQWGPPHNFQWVTTDVITHWYLDILLYSNNQFLFGDSPGLGTWRQR